MSERLTELDVARLEAVRDSLGRRAAESDNRDAAASLRGHGTVCGQGATTAGGGVRP
jgi:hypothetical protein